MTIEEVIKSLGESTGRHLVIRKHLEPIELSSFKAYQNYVLELYDASKDTELLLKREYVEKFTEATEEKVKNTLHLKFLQDVFKLYTDRNK